MSVEGRPIILLQAERIMKQWFGPDHKAERSFMIREHDCEDMAASPMDPSALTMERCLPT